MATLTLALAKPIEVFSGRAGRVVARQKVCDALGDELAADLMKVVPSSARRLTITLTSTSHARRLAVPPLGMQCGSRDGLCEVGFGEVAKRQRRWRTRRAQSEGACPGPGRVATVVVCAGNVAAVECFLLVPLSADRLIFATALRGVAAARSCGALSSRARVGARLTATSIGRQRVVQAPGDPGCTRRGLEV